jgi:hypothetical protein
MQDQTIVQKWTNSGLLRDVKPHLEQRAAERLEASQRNQPGGYNGDALNRELESMDRDGYFESRSVNSNRRKR